jgi:hypothetical protein
MAVTAKGFEIATPKSFGYIPVWCKWVEIGVDSNPGLLAEF